MGNNKTCIRNYTDDSIYVTLHYNLGKSSWNKREIKANDYSTDVFVDLNKEIDITIEGKYGTVKERLSAQESDYYVVLSNNKYQIKSHLKTAETLFFNGTGEPCKVTFEYTPGIPKAVKKTVEADSTLTETYPDLVKTLKIIVEGKFGTLEETLTPNKQCVLTQGDNNKFILKKLETGFSK